MFLLFCSMTDLWTIIGFQCNCTKVGFLIGWGSLLKSSFTFKAGKRFFNIFKYFFDNFPAKPVSYKA